MPRETKKDLIEQKNQLLKEILILVEDRDFLKVVEIKARYQLLLDQEKAIWLDSNIKQFNQFNYEKEMAERFGNMV